MECFNNAQFYKSDSSENGQRLYASFCSIQDEVEAAVPVYKEIEKVVHEYDFDTRKWVQEFSAYYGIS